MEQYHIPGLAFLLVKDGEAYEIIHNCKFIKSHQDCFELNIQTDGYYYFDSDKKEIAFLELTSNGNIAVGNVKEENGKLLF